MAKDASNKMDSHWMKNSSIHSSNSIFQNYVFYLQTTIPVTALIDGEGHMTKTLNGPIQFGSIY